MEPEPLVEERLRKIPEASQFYLGFAKCFKMFCDTQAVLTKTLKACSTLDDLTVNSDSEREWRSSFSGMLWSLTYIYTFQCLVTTHQNVRRLTNELVFNVCLGRKK